MKLLNEELLTKISEYITKYQMDAGESPSQRKIAARLSLDHKKTYRYVHALAGKGLIKLNDDGTIALPHNLDARDVNHVPLVGAIKCGEPALAVDDFEEMLKLPRKFTGTGEFFMLIAKGDSMIDAGIYAGDFLVIRRQSTAELNDIVAACKKSDISEDEEATLKRYKRINGKLRYAPRIRGLRGYGRKRVSHNRQAR
jgi:repressor LexA